MKQQHTPLKFSPYLGSWWVGAPSTAAEYRQRLKVVWDYNPWTGTPRDPGDVESDPYGLLLVPPGEDVVSAREELHDAAEAASFEEAAPVSAEAWSALPCRNRNCECPAGKCSHPGYLDARGYGDPTPVVRSELEPEHTLHNGPLPTTANALLSDTARAQIAEALQKHLAETTKPTNPKDAIGTNKLPLHLWPATATAMGCLGLLDGALKYGRSNFRAIGVRASIYADAAKRHLDAWFEGEECDPDSGLPHFAHTLACIAILVDSQAAGKLNDDRMVAGGYRDLVTSLTPNVARLRELHAGKDPKHYMIGDSV